MSQLTGSDQLTEEIEKDNLVELWRAFATTWKKWYRKAEENISPLDISIPEYRMISFLVEHGPTPMAKLANSIDVSQGWITSMVDRLEVRKMVRRTRSDTDRRIINIEVLDKGRKNVHKARELHLQFVRRTLGKFRVEEQEKFMNLLTKLSDDIENDR